MKRTLLQVAACLAIIVAGVFFTTTHAEAAVFAHPSATGCTAPVGGDSISPCTTPSPNKKASVVAPVKHHWHHHRHWHFHRHFHFRHHHFRSHRHHWSFHHHGAHHGHRSHGGGHHGRHHH